MEQLEHRTTGKEVIKLAIWDGQVNLDLGFGIERAVLLRLCVFWGSLQFISFWKYPYSSALANILPLARPNGPYPSLPFISYFLTIPNVEIHTYLPWRNKEAMKEINHHKDRLCIQWWFCSNLILLANSVACSVQVPLTVDWPLWGLGTRQVVDWRKHRIQRGTWRARETTGLGYLLFATQTPHLPVYYGIVYYGIVSASSLQQDPAWSITSTFCSIPIC